MAKIAPKIGHLILHSWQVFDMINNSSSFLYCGIAAKKVAIQSQNEFTI